jgi:hypothetical protein
MRSHQLRSIGLITPDAWCPFQRPNRASPDVPTFEHVNICVRKCRIFNCKLEFIHFKDCLYLDWANFAKSEIKRDRLALFRLAICQRVRTYLFFKWARPLDAIEWWHIWRSRRQTFSTDRRLINNPLWWDDDDSKRPIPGKVATV